MKYKAGYKYTVYETEKIQTDIIPEHTIKTDLLELDDRGLLTINKYYAWDGASGPAIDTKTFRLGSLAHDALYQLMRLGLLDRKHRKAADLLLKKLCLYSGMWRVRAEWVYLAVQTFAQRASEPEAEPKVQEVKSYQLAA